MKKEKIKEELLSIFEDIFEISKDELKQTDSFQQIKKWDSLAHAQLVAAIASEFDIYLSNEEAADLTSISSTIDTIYNKLIASKAS